MLRGDSALRLTPFSIGLPCTSSGANARGRSSAVGFGRARGAVGRGYVLKKTWWSACMLLSGVAGLSCMRLTCFAEGRLLGSYVKRFRANSCPSRPMEDIIVHHVVAGYPETS